MIRAPLSGNQCSWACGAEADGLAPQTMMHAESCEERGSNPHIGGAVEVVERGVARVIADGVWLDLCRPQPVEETIRSGIR